MITPSERIKGLLQMFDSFCVTVIRNFSRNLKRAAENRQKHDGTGEEPVEYLIESLSHEEVYKAEQLVLSADGLSCVVEDELLYKALLSLPENQQRVILYDFWENLRTGKYQKDWRLRYARCITCGSVHFKKSVHIMK